MGAHLAEAVKVSISIPRRVLDALDRIAREDDRPRSRVVRAFVEEGLKRRGKPK